MNGAALKKSSSSVLHGILAALVTPMTRRQAVNYNRLEAFADHLIREGVHGLIPLGSTGEYYALNPQERCDVLKATLHAANRRVPVLAGTNAGSTREVIALSREAEESGAAGVMLAPPYYSLPRPEELFAHFRAINDAIGIPIMLYNYPGRTGVDMTPEFIERLAGLKNVRYVKESTGEMPRITELLRRCGDRLRVFCGCDTIALESLVVGAVGWVGGAVNVLPRQHVALYELTVERGEYAAARELFFQMLPMLELMEGGGKYTQFVKAACALSGQPVGPPRQPLLTATRAESRRLAAALRSVAD
jgi:4-hydroxy-tetrahydrodipicolinate synthase